MTAFAIAVAVTLGVLFGLRVFDATGRTVVPLTGMVVGNSIAATVLVGRRITEEMRDKREEIEARLALGLPGPVAARPYVRGAVRTALVPQIETTKAVGVVFLPGAMVGLILAGADPMQAVRVQIAVMYLVLGSVAMTTSVVAIGLERRLVTPDHRLVPLPPRGVDYRCFRAALISSRITGSSMVDGTATSRPSAIARIVARSTLPERVLGSRATTSASLKEATAPMRSRTMATSSACSSADDRSTPAFSTTKPIGT
jgi:hypothetical protein